MPISCSNCNYEGRESNDNGAYDAYEYYASMSYVDSCEFCPKENNDELLDDTSTIIDDR